MTPNKKGKGLDVERLSPDMRRSSQYSLADSEGQNLSHQVDMKEKDSQTFCQKMYQKVFGKIPVQGPQNICFTV